MLRFFVLRFVLPLIVFLILRSILKSVWGNLTSSVAHKPDRGGDGFQPGGELKRDPVCGTYVAANASITRNIGGETLHFCSQACRDKYRPA
jgi:YHS domain-containing protein